MVNGVRGYRVKRHSQQYVSYIVAVSFIGGGNRSSKRNHRPAVRYRKTLSHSAVSSTPRHRGDYDHEDECLCKLTRHGNIEVIHQFIFATISKPS